MRQHSTTTMEMVGFVSNRGKPIEMSSELKADKLQVLIRLLNLSTHLMLALVETLVHSCS